MKIRQFMTYLGMREKNNNKLHQEHVSYTKTSTVNSKENLPIFVFLQTKVLKQQSYKYKGVLIAINWLCEVN